MTMYREKLEKQKELEQPFVKRFYVVENRQAVPLEIKRFGNLDDAMSHYQALPYHYMLWQESDYVSHVPNFNCTATKIIKTVCFSLHNNYII